MNFSCPVELVNKHFLHNDIDTATFLVRTVCVFAERSEKNVERSECIFSVGYHNVICLQHTVNGKT